MIETSFIPTNLKTDSVEEGIVSWSSPSNIALVKYWGKTEPQIPKNPSISFTLTNCSTKTTLKYRKKKKESSTFEFAVFFEGNRMPAFEPKIKKFMERIVEYQPFLLAYDFEIHTENSFPHSSGIASSASGMSALALCLMSLEQRIDPSIDVIQFNKKASFLARLGSGSAARSIEGPLVVWGLHEQITGSNDLYGIRYPFKVHKVFMDYQDTVLLVDKGVKQVSSTLGHGLMENHPYSSARFDQAHAHLSQLIQVLETGDLDNFNRIVEKEALALHAMMMTSDPYFILMRPNTLEIIERIWRYRKETGSKLCFTLDAGANVHLLYPKKEKESVNRFLTEEILEFCQNKHFISDEAGSGAVKLDDVS